MLAKGSDETLKALAAEELAAQQSADALARVGDAWWDLAQKPLEVTNRGALLAHAASLYRRAVGEMSGLRRELLEQRIAEADKAGAPLKAPISVRIYACADDQFQMYLNGRLILEGATWRELKSGDFKVSSGDLLLVRAINNGGRRGFACAIKLPGDSSIATAANGKWQTYTPRDPRHWFDAKGISQVKPVRRGDRAGILSEVSNQSGVAAQPIWAEGDTCYFMLRIP